MYPFKKVISPFITLVHSFLPFRALLLWMVNAVPVASLFPPPLPCTANAQLPRQIQSRSPSQPQSLFPATCSMEPSPETWWLLLTPAYQAVKTTLCISYHILMMSSFSVLLSLPFFSLTSGLLQKHPGLQNVSHTSAYEHIIYYRPTASGSQRVRSRKMFLQCLSILVINFRALSYNQSSKQTIVDMIFISDLKKFKSHSIPQPKVT